MHDKLMSIETGIDENDFKEGVKNGYTIDCFASVLSDKTRLPENDVIDKDLKKAKAAEGDKFSFRDFINNYDYDDSFKNIFVGEDATKKFNNNFMFIGLNAAYRKGVEKMDWSDWGNFHSTDSGNKKLRLLTNDRRFEGCYITDAIKGHIDSTAKDVIAHFSKNKNSAELKNSARILEEEIVNIDPKQLIIFGDKANTNEMLGMMKQYFNNQKVIDLIDNGIVSEHYSSQKTQAYEIWYDEKQKELKTEINNKNKVTDEL